MAFNLSEEDLELYYNANTAATASIFTVLVFPPFLLCLLCMLALLITREINPIVRLVLLDIFAAEVCLWFSFAIFYLGWPSRFLYDKVNLCKVFISSYRVGSMQKFTAGAIYGVVVYLIVKHGEKKIKAYAIVTCIAVSWILTASTVGVIPYIEEFGAASIHGFCKSNSTSLSYKIIISTTLPLSVFFSIIQFVCGVMVFVYIKRNTLHENKKMKKAIAKVLVYLIVVSILSLINSGLPVINPIIFKEVIRLNSTVRLVAVNYVVRLLANVPAIATPIVAIALLKPVRVAMKTMMSKVCVCLSCLRKTNSTTTTTTTTTTTAAATATTSV